MFQFFPKPEIGTRACTWVGPGIAKLKQIVNSEKSPLKRNPGPETAIRRCRESMKSSKADSLLQELTRLAHRDVIG